MIFDIEKRIAIALGVKVNHMTIYKAELIHLRNDGLGYKDISNIVGENEDKVGRWLSREAQPKKEAIEILENNYFNRINKKIDFTNTKLIAHRLGIKY